MKFELWIFTEWKFKTMWLIDRRWLKLLLLIDDNWLLSHYVKRGGASSVLTCETHQCHWWRVDGFIDKWSVDQQVLIRLMLMWDSLMIRLHQVLTVNHSEVIKYFRYSVTVDVNLITNHQLIDRHSLIC